MIDSATIKFELFEAKTTIPDLVSKVDLYFNKNQCEVYTEDYKRSFTHLFVIIQVKGIKDSIKEAIKEFNLMYKERCEKLEHRTWFDSEFGNLNKPLRYEGKVKWYNAEQGFGFIESDELDVDILLHYTNLGDTVIEEGDRVEFEIDHSGRSGVATEITVNNDLKS